MATVNPDDYILCRNIPVRKALIEEYKQKHGQLVEDTRTLLKLDAGLAEFRKRNNGKSPTVTEGDDGYYYLFEHVIVPVSLYLRGGNFRHKNHELPLLDGELQVPGDKPIWFRVPKKFVIGRAN